MNVILLARPMSAAIFVGAASFASAALFAAPVAASSWTLDSEASVISFRATQQQAAVEGVFGEESAEITFDPADLANASAVVRVALASTDSQNGERDGALRGSDWFDVANTPDAVFTSSAFVETGANQYDVAGVLEIRGVAQEVVWPLEIVVDGDRATASGALEIDRLVFGVGQGDWAATNVIAAEVVITVALEADRAL